MKIFFLFPLFLLVLLGKLLITIIPIILILFATIVIGCTGFTCEFICSQCEDNCLLALILVIFLPISMIIGVVMAFGEVFCPAAGDIVEENCGSIEDVC